MKMNLYFVSKHKYVLSHLLIIPQSNIITRTKGAVTSTDKMHVTVNILVLKYTFCYKS